MRFKQYFKETKKIPQEPFDTTIKTMKASGIQEKYQLYELQKTSKRWSFLNTETKKRYFLKLGEDQNNVGVIQRFLEDLGAKNGENDINYSDMAVSIIKNEKCKIHVKDNMWEAIKKAWVIG